MCKVLKIIFYLYIRTTKSMVSPSGNIVERQEFLNFMEQLNMLPSSNFAKNGWAQYVL